MEIPAFSDGPYPVGTSDLRIADGFSSLEGAEMNRYLIGERQGNQYSFVDEILLDRQNPLLLNVNIPDNKTLYGVAAGLSFPVFLHVTYPTRADNPHKDYQLPYAFTTDTRYPRVQAAGDKPIFADENKRYPLLLSSHGMNSHGFWSASGSTRVSSHGYIVATLHFGDGRFSGNNEVFLHEQLRPYLAQAALDFLLEHPHYRANIDPQRIAASGHSMGGYTALALAGGEYAGSDGAIQRPRVRAAIASAPWTGSRWNGGEHYPFGENNIGLAKIEAPVLGLYGDRDAIVQPAFVLSAFEQLAGPRYVVQLIDQPHIYAPGSWQDQGNWVLLFLAAHLKDDEAARKQLSEATSMQGGGADQQRFDLQRSSSEK